MKFIPWVVRLLVPGDTFYWYSRLAPKELKIALLDSAIPPTKPALPWENLFSTIDITTLFEVELCNNQFKLQVSREYETYRRRRRSRAEIVLVGEIAPYADGSLLQGKVKPNRLTSFVSLTLLPLAMVFALAQTVLAAFTSLANKVALGNSVLCMIALLAVTRLSYHLSKDYLLSQVKGRFIAREIKPAAIHVNLKPDH